MNKLIESLQSIADGTLAPFSGKGISALVSITLWPANRFPADLLTKLQAMGLIDVQGDRITS